MPEVITTPLEILQQAQAGDPVQISALYERYHLGVFRYLYYRLHDRQTAEDLTSEVFLRMLRFLPEYRLQGSPFRAWLYQIARNLAIDHFRRTSGREQVQMEENLFPSDHDPVAAVERRLDSLQLKRALVKLNDDQRDVLVLRFVVGLPIAEVAAALNKSENAVKGLQRRGLAELRSSLSDLEVDYV